MRRRMSIGFSQWGRVVLRQRRDVVAAREPERHAARAQSVRHRKHLLAPEVNVEDNAVQGALRLEQPQRLGNAGFGAHDLGPMLLQDLPQVLRHQVLVLHHENATPIQSGLPHRVRHFRVPHGEARSAG